MIPLMAVEENAFSLPFLIASPSEGVGWVHRMRQIIK
jgi:hypothetical protein